MDPDPEHCKEKSKVFDGQDPDMFRLCAREWIPLLWFLPTTTSRLWSKSGPRLQWRNSWRTARNARGLASSQVKTLANLFMHVLSCPLLNYCVIFLMICSPFFLYTTFLPPMRYGWCSSRETNLFLPPMRYGWCSRRETNLAYNFCAHLSDSQIIWICMVFCFFLFSFFPVAFT